MQYIIQYWRYKGYYKEGFSDIKALYKYIDVLSPREKRIIIKRYGLDNTKELTQKTIMFYKNSNTKTTAKINKKDVLHKKQTIQI